MAYCIYVEIDNLNPLFEWLKTKPDGELKVLIGGTTDSVPFVMKALGSDYDLALWMYYKVTLGELEIQSTILKSDLPVGVVIED